MTVDELRDLILARLRVPTRRQAAKPWIPMSDWWIRGTLLWIVFGLTLSTVAAAIRVLL